MAHITELNIEKAHDTVKPCISLQPVENVIHMNGNTLNLLKSYMSRHKVEIFSSRTICEEKTIDFEALQSAIHSFLFNCFSFFRSRENIVL